jgi:hypothetical protein
MLEMVGRHPRDKNRLQQRRDGEAPALNRACLPSSPLANPASGGSVFYGALSEKRQAPKPLPEGVLVFPAATYCAH